MNSELSSDDLPMPSTARDRLLQLRLEERVAEYFYLSCDRITRSILSGCQWKLTLDTNALTLTVSCPNIATYWHVREAIVQLGQNLSHLATDQAKLRICPPEEKGRPFEIRVYEIPQNGW